jgi:hypothetical protein
MSEKRATTRRGAAVVLAAVALGAAVLVGGCGDDDDGSAGGEGSGFCSDLERVVDAGVELNQALASGDADGLRTAMDAYPPLAAAAEESAPPEIAEEIGVLRQGTDDLLERLEGVDAADPAAVEAAVVAVEDVPELEEAGNRISDYASESCGFDPDAGEGG